VETQTASDIDGVGPAGDVPPVREKRRWIVWTAVIAVAVLVAGGLSWLLAYGATYQPLSPGDTWGGANGAMKEITNGLNDTDLIEVGGKGARGTFDVSLVNRGSHPVRILPTAQHPPVQDWGGPRFYVQWEPSPNGGDPPAGTKPRAFPVTLSAGEQILIIVTDVQPACSRNGGYYTTEQLYIRWSALGWHHVYDYALTGGTSGGAGPLPVVNCPPASAVHYIDKNA
jgi:hypothetical protein